MAATSMSKAGLEVGCKVVISGNLFAHDYKDSITVDREPATVLDLRPGIDGYAGRVETEGYGTADIPIRPDIVIERDYDDAQAARHKRIDALLAHYPADAGVPEGSDTIERFVLVQGHPGSITDENGIKAPYAYTNWGDTFEDAVQFAGGEVLDGWMPEAVFDLDTGDRIELHVSSPVITRSEDQGAMINVLKDLDDLRTEAIQLSGQETLSANDARRLEVVEEILAKAGRS